MFHSFQDKIRIHANVEGRWKTQRLVGFISVMFWILWLQLGLIQSNLNSMYDICLCLHLDMVKSRGMTEWFLGEEMKRRKNPEARRQQAAAELEAERRNILNAMKYREPERGGPQTTATILRNQFFRSAEIKFVFSTLDPIKLSLFKYSVPPNLGWFYIHLNNDEMIPTNQTHQSLGLGL